MTAHIVAIVAPNGLGHFRRVAAVMERLTARSEPGAVTVSVIAEHWQRDRMAGWPVLDRLDASGCRWSARPLEANTAWARDLHLEGGDRLAAWEAGVAADPLLDDASLVVSDNLVGVLAFQPDAVLMGSFLWSDLFAHTLSHARSRCAGAVDPIVERDRRLLATHRPPMICVGDVAMPGVRERTEPVPVGWMTEPDLEPADPCSTRVAVLGGRTGAADRLLARAAETLIDGGHDVVVDEGLLPLQGQQPGAVFDYHRASWTNVGAVVCRPGVGTLTECVGHRLPVIAVYERANAELEHNGRRVGALGIGIDAGAEPDPAAVADAVAAVFGTRGDAIRSAMADLPGSGLDDAAAWLANRLGVTLR